MGFFSKVKKAFGSEKEDVESQNNANDEIIDKPTPNDKIRNFKYLDDLIHSGEKEIVLDSDIILSEDEESEYREGIKIDVEISIEGNGHSIDAKNKARIFKIYSKLTIKNLTLKNGHAIDGGAINIQKGDVDITGCQFHENTADNHGGAILNWAKLSLAKTIFKGNSTQEKSGGAINIQKGDVDITDCQFQENTAKDSGGAILNWAELSLTKTTFNGNSTQENNGGAINIREGNADITGCRFQDNTANNQGGAIFTDKDGDADIAGCQFQKNTAKDGGGAMINFGRLSVTETMFDGNSTQEKNGGAILNWGKLTLTETTFKGNSTQELSGGAINIQEGDVDITGCQFHENTAKQSGGAILNWGKLTLTQTIFKGNSTQEFSGGAINIQPDGDVDITGCQFQENTANKNGGAIINFGKLTLTETMFVRNSTREDEGGAISIQKGDVDMTGCQFQENTVKNHGGAISIQPDSNVDITNCQFQENTTNKNGGAIINFGKLTLTQTTFKRNSTQEKSGGAINIQDSGAVDITGCQFQENTAKEDGGAIKNLGKLSVTESMFMRNTSEESSGGAISSPGSEDMEITDCQFLKNTAKEHAGAIGNFGKSSITGTLFKENSTRKNNGGAISNQPQGDMNITNCRFEENAARDSGGAIQNYGKLSIMGTLFNKNIATGGGGALFNHPGSHLRVDNCDFKSNNATGAHCIYNDSDNVKIIDSIFSHHKGSDKPISNKVLGTLFSSHFPNSLIFNKDSMDIIGCTFESNEKYDNVIFSEKESRLTISGGKIKNNHVKNTAVFTEAVECNISGTTFKDNIILSSDNQRGADIINESKLSIQALKIANDNAILNKGHIDVRRLSPNERKRIIYNVGDASIDEFNPPSEDKFDFTHLSNMIENDSDEKAIILNEDISLENYELDFYEGGIDLDKDTLTIDGQNHFIDGKHKTRIFNITGKNITLKNIIFKNGSAMNIYGEHIGGGGAIKIAKNSSLTLENCKFIDNISQDDGGAILNNGTLQSENNKFIGNSSQYNGGAIHNSNEMHTANDSFENNSSKIAGAIYNRHMLTIKKDIILENNRSDLKEDIYNANNIKTETDLNTAKTIFNTHNINTDEDTDEWQTFQYLNAKLKDPHAILDKDIKMEFEDIDDDLILMDDIEFDGKGHIIDLNNRNINFKIKNNVTIKHLTLRNALISKDSFFKIEGNLRLENVKFLNNRINAGCYLLNNQGNAEVIDSHFYNNHIKNNSLISTTHNLEIANTAFINNHSNSYGTAVNIASGKALVQNSLFKYNSTTKSGGAIIVDDSSVFEVSKSEFIKNTAKQNGGAILNWGKLSIMETLFKGNSTRKGTGGAININKTFSNADITNCRFEENTAIDKGGAIWYYSKENINLKDCTFKDNEPDDAYRYSII